MSELVLVDTAERIRTISFNRPDKKNALTRAMYTAAAQAIEDGERNGDVRAFILTGTSGVFTAGNDIVDFMERPPAMGSDETPPVGRFMNALLHAKKPVVAAVDGLAIGIGVTLLMHCDLVYCSDRASFKTPFVDLALAPEYGSSQTMTRAFGHQIAAELLMLGASWDAWRAEQTGLVTRTTTPEALMDTARTAAAALAAKPPAALAKAKELMRMAPEPVEDRVAREGRLFSELLQSPEFAEAAAAFMERRAPDFDKLTTG
ncbi:enoyl-CoA hydratase-related protein [Maricaulis sp.]|uniref:enoyl-CoA hydratase-related protein n=1 Tax=Maricaulis sp. TaxID=1486257 RepID=UPI002631D241|nr:enoyl-CoA hydratase-related protein [Maricaulis sp.]